MSRENKYRAWDNVRNKMWEWNMASRDIDLGNILSGKSNLKPLQFTGLKDKNGVEIYEGDVLERYSRYKKTEVGLVQYDNNYAGFLGRDTLLWLTSSIGGQEFDGKVIGNIYENPELLEETK